MKENEKRAISRRHFLGLMGAGAAAGAMTMTGCAPKKDAMYDPAGHHSSPVPTDQMTYRTWPNLDNDRISLLG